MERTIGSVIRSVRSAAHSPPQPGVALPFKLLASVRHLPVVSVDDFTRTDSAFTVDLRRLGHRLLHVPQESTDNGFFSLLPYEILLKVLAYLDPVALARCAAVCKLFRDTVADQQLYTTLCLKCFFHLANDQCLTYYADR